MKKTLLVVLTACTPPPDAVTSGDGSTGSTGDPTTGPPGPVYCPHLEVFGKSCYRQNRLGIAAGPLALADFDRDGHLDLVVHPDASVQVYRGRGDGSFAPPTTLQGEYHGLAIAVGDFDGDGLGDVAQQVSADDADDFVGLIPGSGGEVFYFALGHHIWFWSVRPLVVGDFDGDGLDDVAAASLAWNAVRMIPGRSDGLPESHLIGVGSVPAALAAADLDHDGDLDLVTANRGLRDTTLLLGDGAGQFFVTPGPATMKHALVLAARDIDDDGHTDLGLAAWDGLQAFRGRGDGSFESAPSTRLPDTYLQGRPLALCDLDGDANLDAALGSNDVSGARGMLYGLRGRPGAQFAAAEVLIAGGKTEILELACADFNADGRDDLVFEFDGELQLLLSHP